ncbi:MAG: UDP-N-acetylmuramoyl-L-alanine--D-glutamate ligase [Pseudomonadota bacterium]
MSTMGDMQKRETLVLGMGLTGASIARWLKRQGRSAVFADTRLTVDTKAIYESLPDAVVITDADATVLEGMTEVIISPGVSDQDPLVSEIRARDIPTHSDITLFARDAAAPIVAVTGTNGKSTVVSLLAHMCQQADVAFAAGGNLGVPVLDLPEPGERGFYLLELSSFQLSRTPELALQCGCVLNIEPDHLDWHGDFSAYEAAKLSIYRNCAYAVVPSDHAWPSEVIDVDAVMIRFGKNPPEDARSFGVVEHEGRRYWASGAEPILAVEEAAMIGEHNVLNIAAALAIGSSIDLPLSAMVAAIRSFPGLDHRHQLVSVIDGVRYVDDSKATNCAAALASAKAVSGPVVMLIGGLGKGEDYDAFSKQLPAHVRFAVAYGTIATEVASALAQNGFDHAQAEDLPRALKAAHAMVQPGDTVLLAPAAASQDAYPDYKARGQHFRQLIEGLAA